MKKGTQTLFTESLKYDSPSSTSGGNALYTGLISERSDQWKFTSYGQGVTTTDGYRYDNGGRLTYVKRGSTVGTFSYDARGNVLTAEGDSYTYSGDRVATFTPSGQSAVYFTHDSRGRMTYDGVGGVTIDYNYLNLPRKISGTGGTLVKYSYLANGSKTEAENGSGAGLVYRGSLIYKKASNGTLTFDGASIPEGRLLSGATRLYVTDHLGSVKAVVNGNNGNLYEVNNYTVYGKRSANSSASSYISTAPTGEKFRQHFTGKEDQAPDFGTAYTDFGARQYSPALRRWMVPDPLSEKYYGVSPYAYCAGDPVNLVDKEGDHPIVFGAVSAVLDFGVQVGVQMLNGVTFSSALKRVDYTSVASSFVLGALSPSSTLTKAISLGVILTDAAVDISPSKGVEYIGQSKELGNVVIDFAVSGGGELGTIVSRRIANGLKQEASSKALATLPKDVKNQRKGLAQVANTEAVQFIEKQVITSGAQAVGEVIKSTSSEQPASRDQQGNLRQSLNEDAELNLFYNPKFGR